MTSARASLLGLIGFLGLIAATAAMAAANASKNGTPTLDPNWRHWAYSQPISYTENATGEPALVRVPLANDVFAHANPDLSDLRVIDDAGTEIGYLLTDRGTSRSPALVSGAGNWRQAKMIDSGYVPGEYTQAIAELDDDGRLHDVVKLELSDREEEFFAWAEIASSPDYETWRILRSKAPAYHFRETRDREAMRLTYPPTRDRYLRVRLQRKDEAVRIASMRIGEQIESKTELVEAGLEFELRSDSPSDESWWESSTSTRTGPIWGVRAETSRSEFHRAVKVSVKTDRDNWQDVGRGLVFRLLEHEQDAATRESLQAEFAGTASLENTTAWRIAVLDGSDPPIDDLRVALLRPAQSVVFRPQAGRDFRLIYGHPRAEAPLYELENLLDRNQIAGAPVGVLGGLEENLGFVSSMPFSERHPALIWAALGLAVLVLGALAIKSLR